MRDNNRHVMGNLIQTEKVTLSLWREGDSRRRERHVQGPWGWKELGFLEIPREGQCS